MDAHSVVPAGRRGARPRLPAMLVLTITSAPSRVEVVARSLCCRVTTSGLSGGRGTRTRRGELIELVPGHAQGQTVEVHRGGPVVSAGGAGRYQRDRQGPRQCLPGRVGSGVTAVWGGDRFGLQRDTLARRSQVGLRGWADVVGGVEH